MARRFDGSAWVLATVFSLLAGACTPGRATGGGPGPGGGGGDGGTSGGGGITVSPPQATVVVNGGPGMQQFTATDKSGADVTGKCAWGSGDPAIGTISMGGLFTTGYPLDHGGVTSVSCNLGGQLGVASVSISYVTPPVVDPSAGQGAAQAFGGPASADPSLAPKVVYPFDSTMLARNINQLRVQWIGAPKNTLYRVRVLGGTIDASFFVGASVCGGGTKCQYKFADKDWQTVAKSASGQQVVLTVAGVASANAPVASSTPLKLNFSPEDVKGGLYYFSTSIRGLKRLPFGASSATTFTSGNGTGCVGCHAISRDGKKVAAVFGGGDGYAGMVQGDDGMKYLLPPDMNHSKYAWNFASFSPDGAKMITNWAGRLALRDGTTGALLKDIDPALYGAKQAVMPEWSPDGNSIVFVGIPQEGFIGKDMQGGFGFLTAGDWILGNAGDIMVMPYNNGAFGPAVKVVGSTKSGEYNFYPSWSPDSKWIVFATGKFPGSSPTAAANGVDTGGKCMSYDQDTARLRLVKAAASSPVLELGAATHALNRTSSWPKFAPFVQGGGKLVFITFSAKFAYGFIVPDQQRPQIWMSAIDLDKAQAELGAGDPSYPPFWLPFQDSNENNHSTTWTNDVACTNQGSDCPPEFTCDNGKCVPKVG